MAHRTVGARRARVRALRAAGMSFREIGRELGISHELARRDARAVGLTTLTPVPDALGSRGQAFWDHAVAAFELDHHEQELLTQVCRLLDRADELRADVAQHGAILTTAKGDRRANPACNEERQVSLALGRLLAQLEIPAEGGGRPHLVSPTTSRARKAANARWQQHNAHKAAWEARRDGEA